MNLRNTNQKGIRVSSESNLIINDIHANLEDLGIKLNDLSRSPTQSIDPKTPGVMHETVNTILYKGEPLCQRRTIPDSFNDIHIYSIVPQNPTAEDLFIEMKNNLTTIGLTEIANNDSKIAEIIYAAADKHAKPPQP